MPNYTQNFSLKKPTYTEPRDVQDFNGNADIIDLALHNLDIGKMTLTDLKALIANDLIQTVAGKLLDATQGKELKTLIDLKIATAKIANNLTSVDGTEVLAAPQGKALSDAITGLTTALNGKAATPVSYNATFLAAGWSATAPFTQTIAVAGILATDTPWVDVVLSDTPATAALELAAYNSAGRVDALAGSVKVTCYETKPITNFKLILKVVR